MALGARGDTSGIRMGSFCFPWMKKLQEKNDVPEGLQRKRVWTDHKTCHLFTYVCMHMCVCVYALSVYASVCIYVIYVCVQYVCMLFLCMHVYVYMLSMYVCRMCVYVCYLYTYVCVYVCYLCMYVHMRVCIYVCIVYMYVCVYVFETGCSYVTLAVLKLTMQTRLASNSQEICLPLLSK